MSNATRPTVHPVSIHLASLFALLVGLLLATPSLALRSAPTLDNPHCAAEAVHDLDLDGAQQVPVVGDSVCVRVYLPSQGVWLIGADDAAVSLVPSACDSGFDGASGGDSIVRRAAHELLVDAAGTGDRIVCAVGVQATSLQLTSRFAASEDRSKTDPTAGTRIGKVGPRGAVRDEALLQALCGDEQTTLTCAAPLRLRHTTDLRTKTEPDPNCQEPDPDPSCKRLGDFEFDAEARAGADLFTFEVETWSILDASLRSDAATLEVLDAFGRQLGVGTEAASDTSLHLAPGSYFLRVDGAGSGDDGYGLSVSVDEAP